MTAPEEFAERLRSISRLTDIPLPAIAEEGEPKHRLEEFLDEHGDYAQCSGCKTHIYWFQHASGKKAPYVASGENMGVNHFIDCPASARFTKIHIIDA